MAGILETLYPQGDYLNIKANSPTRRDYNINVMADLVNNLPSQFSIAYPAAAATLSLPYDGIQALTRTTDKDFNQATTMGGLTGREIAADALGILILRVLEILYLKWKKKKVITLKDHKIDLVWMV
jgi:hypothetical protein